jgi:hypothetical protein
VQNVVVWVFAREQVCTTITNEGRGWNCSCISTSDGCVAACGSTCGDPDHKVYAFLQAAVSQARLITGGEHTFLPAVTAVLRSKAAIFTSVCGSAIPAVGEQGIVLANAVAEATVKRVDSSSSAVTAAVDATVYVLQQPRQPGVSVEPTAPPVKGLCEIILCVFILFVCCVRLTVFVATISSFVCVTNSQFGQWLTFFFYLFG